MGIIVGNSSHSQSLSTTEGRRSTGQALISVGVDLIENGHLDEALEVFQRAQTTLSIDAGATKKDDHVNDAMASDYKQHERANGVSPFATTHATSDQDNNAVSSSANHVPKPPPPPLPSSSCRKRLRQARSLAKRDSVCAEKKRRTELADGNNAKIHGGNSNNSSSPSRRMNSAAAKKGRGTKSAEEMAQVEMYREEISEDSVSVIPRDEELFLALALCMC